MSVVESISHPLVSEVSDARDSVHMQYTMDGVEHLQAYIYEDRSAPGSSRAFFTAKPPLGSLVDRQILVELAVDVTTSTSAANLASFGDYFAPKCFPVNRAIDTCQISVNSQAIMSEPSRICEVLSRHRTNQESIKKFRSLSTCEPDAFNRYENYALGASYAAIHAARAAIAVPPFAAADTILYNDATYSPFKYAPYGCGNDDYESRMSFPYTEVVAGYNTTRTYTFTEVLMNPLCMYREGKAMAHCTSLDINLQFGDLTRIFSQIRSIAKRTHTNGNDTLASSWNGLGTSDVDLGNVAAGYDRTQGGAPLTVKIKSAKLILRYATPSVQISPRQTISLNHFRVNTQSLATEKGDLTTGLKTVNFNPIRLSVIPSHVFIYAKPITSAQKPWTADAFLKLENLSLTISNRTGMLSNMTPQQLYTMSAENGINMSYTQWRERIGSVLCLGFGKDIVGLAPGLREYIDFSFRVDVQNTTYFDHTGKTAVKDGTTVDRSIDWELVCWFVTPQQLTLEDQVGTLEMGFSSDELSDSLQYGPSSESIEDMNQIVGSGFGDWLKRGYHKAHHLVKKYARPVEQVLRSAEHVPGLGGLAGPAADIADQLAKSVGTGMKGRLALTRGRGKMY